jgi:hypothetical protein
MQVRFEHSNADQPEHDLAAPVSLIGQGADVLGNPVVLLKAVGGLTKLEHVAAMCIDCAMSTISGFPRDPDENLVQLVAARAAQIAEALLAECAKRQAPKAESAIEVAG